MRVLYFDCFSGAAGDMILGALIDAGVPFDEVRRALGSLAIADDSVWIERVTRASIGATKLRVQGEDLPADRAHDDHDHHHHDHGPGHRHAHSHDHPQTDTHETVHHHSHRSLAEIYRLVDGSALNGAAKDRAKALFHRLGEAEAAIHGMPLEQVHLHEVGALDSIIDIVGAVYALESLRVDRFVSSPLNVGSGTVRSAHGLYPVPAPATARLLQGVPIYAGPQQAEMVTPTGALLVTSYATEYGPLPRMQLRQIGYGAGARDFPDTPNVLRVLIGEEERRSAVPADGAAADAQTHTVTVLEAEIDDMNPQIFGVVMDRLLAAGALDVYYTPVQMKKNRPGTLMTVIAAPAARERLTGIIFRETTTIGVRYRDMARECLERDTIAVPTPLGDVRVKVARRGGEVLNVSPEFDDCVRLGAEHGVAVKDVQAMAIRAYGERT